MQIFFIILYIFIRLYDIIHYIDRIYIKGVHMKIINKLALNYLKKNKKRSTATVFRHCYCHTANNCSHCASFKLPKIYDKYCSKQEKLGS